MWFLIRTVVTMMAIMVICMMSIRILVKTLFTVEHQEIETEGVKGSDKNTSQHGKGRKTSTWQMALMNRFNNAAGYLMKGDFVVAGALLGSAEVLGIVEEIV